MVSYPTTGVSQVFGLLDILRSVKGRTDIARLNVDLHLDIDELLPTIDTAELLGFVSVKEGDVSLTEVGRKVLSSSMQNRKRIVGEQARKTDLYAKLLEMIRVKRKLTRAAIAEAIESLAGPMSKINEAVAYTIRWGVFAELFGYDGSSLILPLQTASASSS